MLDNKCTIIGRNRYSFIGVSVIVLFFPSFRIPSKQPEFFGVHNKVVRFENSTPFYRTLLTDRNINDFMFNQSFREKNDLNCVYFASRSAIAFMLLRSIAAGRLCYKTTVIHTHCTLQGETIHHTFYTVTAVCNN